ncbi:uncharacterized protein LOC106866896 [Brachypodium distachyon]|uniref:uncharacterized protein LOC106866896 n=1 Tax=Brachypodium distachyon TaxID=15368 RepID=UPI00071CD26E|nr:uncharacterized protein LOC106866896 [Brachypodium distachyon]|eukprot:XP_014758814.1 uncharacterized protein LOC106866896 [Brachypodium distachyon]
MDKENVKNTLLRKILAEIMTSKREPPNKASQSNMSAPGDNTKSQENPATGDEENQLSIDSSQIKSPGRANEEQTARSGLQEALLSLTSVICDKLIISADDFDDAARKIAPGEGEFVRKLKDIVDTNCRPHQTV